MKLQLLAEQTAIASVLSEMDAELAGLEQRREKDTRPQGGDDAGTPNREDEID